VFNDAAAWVAYRRFEEIQGYFCERSASKCGARKKRVGNRHSVSGNLG